jgi:hypothetical protein
MHVKLQTQMGWWQDELKEYAKHVEYWFRKYMKYDIMDIGMIYLNEKHQ